MTTPPRILYCHCQYAQVVPPEVKAAVLQKDHVAQSEPGSAPAAWAMNSCALSRAARGPDEVLLGLALAEALAVAGREPRALARDRPGDASKTDRARVPELPEPFPRRRP